MDLAAHFPTLVDGVIGLTVLEGVALVIHHRLTGGGVRPRDFMLNLVSGLCLMLALRCALREQGALWIAAWLAAAGAAHATDMGLRWARRRGAGHTAPVSFHPRP